jgi:hypothetical protein
MLRRFSGRLAGTVSAQQFAQRRRAPGAAGRQRDFDVEGTAHESDPPVLGRDAP